MIWDLTMDLRDVLVRPMRYGIALMTEEPMDKAVGGKDNSKYQTPLMMIGTT